MPIYEYRCPQCGQKARKLWRSFSDVDDASLQCPRCGAKKFQRLVSRVAFLRSEESRLENLADPSSLGDVDESDPRSLGRWLRDMGHQVGEEMPPEFDEIIDRLEAGQSPEEIEESMPDLAAGMDEMGGTGGLSDGIVDL